MMTIVMAGITTAIMAVITNMTGVGMIAIMIGAMGVAITAIGMMTDRHEQGVPDGNALRH